MLDPGMGRVAWSVDAAPELLKAAEDARTRISSRDLSEFPAGTQRNTISEWQRCRLDAVDHIIETLRPYLPSPAEGAEQFLREI